MKRTILVAFALVAIHSKAGLAQTSGNIGYSQSSGSARAEQNEHSKRILSKDEIPPTRTSMFLESSVLMNVKPDEYVAVFVVRQEDKTIADCGHKMDKVISQFTNELRTLGIENNEVFVDFAAQNKVYEYEASGDIAKEKLAGFEIKKNVSIHYRDKALLDKLVVAASHAEIFDLIKVDCIIKDTQSIRNRLMEETTRIIKQKAARYEKLLGIRLLQPGQIYADKSSSYYPTEMYDSYVAYESEDVSANYSQPKYVIQKARKSRTFFFNPLNAKSFDGVVNPVVLEPVVQFTLYLKLRYETELPLKLQKNKPGKAKT